MKTKRRRKGKAGGGRALETILDLVLVLIVVAFGISIAARYGTNGAEVMTEVPRQSSSGLQADRGLGKAEGRRDAAGTNRAAPGTTRDGQEGGRGDSGSAGGAETRDGFRAGAHDGGGRSSDPNSAGEPPTAMSARSRDEERARRRKISVDLRNGCGRVGIAEEMTDSFRAAGFDVVEYRNADNFDYRQTLVKDLVGKPGAQEVCSWMTREFGVGRLLREPVATAGSDVQVILGQDLADTLRQRERRGR